MNDREQRELDEAIRKIGPEGMKRLGTRIWIGIAVFIVALIVFSVVMNHVCPGVGISC